MKGRMNSGMSIQQMDRKIKPGYGMEKIQFAGNGWIHTMRQLLNMSLAQLARKMYISPQGVKNMETREQENTITLKSLSEAADAMDMKLVYGFIPKDGSLEQLIERKARELAIRIVVRTNNTMILEEQGNTEEDLAASIRKLTEEFKREIPGTLWD